MVYGEKGKESMNVKKIFTSVRVLILLAFVLFSFLAIQPNPSAKGVVMRSIEVNSTAALAGFDLPTSTDSPMSYERITSINNKPIETEEEYYAITSELQIGDSVQFKTNKGLYRLTVLAEKEIIELNGTKTIFVNETYTVNETVNGTEQTVEKTRQVSKKVPLTEEKIIGPADLDRKSVV